MLCAHLDRPERHRYLWSDWTAEQVVNACGTPYLVWIRQTFGYEGYRWQVQHTEPHRPWRLPSCRVASWLGSLIWRRCN